MRRLSGSGRRSNWQRRTGIHLETRLFDAYCLFFYANYVFLLILKFYDYEIFVINVNLLCIIVDKLVKEQASAKTDLELAV